LRGETVTGNSIIRLASRMDAGAILGQSCVEIGPLETAGELHDRLAKDGAALMANLLPRHFAGNVSEQSQDESQATLAPKLSRQSTRISWTRPADEIANQIRGLYPWPGCRVCLKDAEGKEVARLTLARARPTVSEGPRWHPGEIMSDGGIASGNDSGVEILECQPEGKRPMSLADYRNGHLWQPGFRVESI
jgi:methionyl-tRNA formyltransferase